MQYNSYPIGNSVRVDGTYTNLARALEDPATVTCIIRLPDEEATETAYVYGTDTEVVKDSTGKYHLWLLPTMPGWHGYRWKGAGTVNSADESMFFVTGSNFVAP